MRYLVVVLGFLLFNGCAYQSQNRMNVKAEKFRYGLISCQNCTIDLQRNMEINQPVKTEERKNEKNNLSGDLTVSD